MPVEKCGGVTGLRGEVPRRITYDNTKVAVSQILEGGKTRRLTRGFLQLKSHYLFAHHFCRWRGAMRREWWRGWSNSRNQFTGTFSGSLELQADGFLRLNDQPLYLRGGEDNRNGLIYGGLGLFSSEVLPDGPILFGAQAGALATSVGHDGVFPVDHQKGILFWTPDGVGILTNSPKAALDVNGSVRINGGTTLTNYLAGQVVMGGGSDANKSGRVAQKPPAKLNRIQSFPKM